MPSIIKNTGRKSWGQRAELFFATLPPQIMVAFIAVMVVVIFINDLISPRGSSEWLWYVFPLLFSTFVHRQNLPWLLAAILSLLTLGGLVFPPTGTLAPLALFSRLVGVAGFGLIALIIESIIGTNVALRASDERFRELIEMESDAHFLVDRDTYEVLHVNKAAQQLYGYSLAEFLALKIDDFSAEPEESRTAIEAGNSFVSIRWHRKKNNERFPVEITTSSFESKGRRLLLGAVRDVTARRRADERIAQLSRMRAILAGVDHAILRINDRQKLQDTICRVAVETGGFQLAWIGMVAPDQSVQPVAQAGVSGYVEKVFADIKPDSPRSKGAAGRAILENRPVMIQDIRLDSRMAPWRDAAEHVGLNYVAAFPIRIAGQATGVFVVYAPVAEFFDENELHLLEQLSDHISHALAAITSDETRKQLELALQLNEERYRTILNEQTDVISRFKADGTITFANDFYCRVFGKSRNELLGEKWQLRPVPEDLPMIKQQLQSLSPTNPLVVIENRIYNSKNEVRWFQFVNRATYDEHGILIETLSVGRDITNSKLAQEQLRKLSHAVEQSPVSIMITDLSGAIEYVNPKFTSLTGYQIEEVLGKNPRLLKSGELSAEKNQQLWNVIRSGKEWHGQFHNRKKNGDLFWEAASISPVFAANGEITHFIAVKEDITAAKVMEARLQELAAIVQSSEDAIISATPEKVIISWNSGAQKLFGYTPSEAIGKNLSLIISPHHLVEAEKIIRLAMHGKPTESFETVRLHKDGTLRHVSVRVSPITDESNNVIGIAGILRDITLVKQLEKTVLEISALERRRVGHELHDGLGQHLAGIALKAKALEYDLAEQSSGSAADAKRIVELTNEAMQRTRQLVSGFDPVEIEVGGLPTALQKFTQQIADTHRMACHFHCETDRLNLDKQINLALFRIAQEATNNALRHGHATQIDIELQIEHIRLTLTIRDNGRGFLTSGQKHHGRGLGIMGYRANSLGGKLFIHSELGGGTKVECVFEINQQPQTDTIISTRHS